MKEAQIPIYLNKGQLIVQALSYEHLSDPTKAFLEKELKDCLNKIQVYDNTVIAKLHSV